MNEKKTEIIRKVRELYLQYGIRSVTMDDVVREVGMSKKTLYQYFKDKSELVEAVITCDREENMIEHDEAISGAKNAVEVMIGFYRFQMNMIQEYKPSMIYDLKKYYPEIHERFVEGKRKIIFENVLKNIKRGKEEGLYRQNLDEEVIATLNLMRVEAFVNTNLFKPEVILTMEFFKQMFTYHMYGIVSAKGREIFEKEINEQK